MASLSTRYLAISSHNSPLHTATSIRRAGWFHCGEKRRARVANDPLILLAGKHHHSCFFSAATLARFVVPLTPCKHDNINNVDNARRPYASPDVPPRPCLSPQTPPHPTCAALLQGRGARYHSLARDPALALYRPHRVHRHPLCRLNQHPVDHHPLALHSRGSDARVPQQHKLRPLLDGTKLSDDHQHRRTQPRKNLLSQLARQGRLRH